MVEHGGCPGVAAVAVITGRAAGDVVTRFSSGDAAVVTTGAGAEHCAVVDAIGRRPACAAVAVFAGIGTGDMAGVLARRGGAIVTA